MNSSKVLALLMGVSCIAGIARFIIEPSFVTFEPPLAWCLACLMWMAWNEAEKECHMLKSVLIVLDAESKLRSLDVDVD